MIVRKILPPTDLSDNSKAGLSYAISLAKEKRAKPSILHVVSLPVYALESLAEEFTGEKKPPISFSSTCAGTRPQTSTVSPRATLAVNWIRSIGNPTWKSAKPQPRSSPWPAERKPILLAWQNAKEEYSCA